MLNCQFSGLSDIGTNRKKNEDYISVVSLDKNNTLAIIADGTGSMDNLPQPAHIAVNEIVNILKREFAEDKSIFKENSEIFIKEAFLSANSVLCALKVANEELYSGFAVSASCCFISDENRITIIHCGNTRVYRIRKSADNKADIRQITTDHTKAQKKLLKKEITYEEYHMDPERLIMTSGLGIVAEPEIQALTIDIRPKDIIFLSTDGVHNAIKMDSLNELIIQSANCDEAAKSLIKGAKMLKYPDDASVIVMFVDDTQ